MTKVIDLAEVQRQQHPERPLTQEVAFLTFMGALINRGVELDPKDYDIMAKIADQVALRDVSLVYDNTLPLLKAA